MQKVKMMAFAGLAVGGLLVGAPRPAFSQGVPPRIVSYLGLTPAQQAQIVTIRQAAAPSMRAALANGDLATAQAIRLQVRAHVLAVLTPDQRARLPVPRP